MGPVNFEKDLVDTTVVIPVYNSEQYIEDAIESVLSQSHINIELIIVDDGSTDRTKYIVSKYPEIHYYYQDNRGASSARNHGLYNSHGKYIVFLDSDDRLLPDRICMGINILEKYPDYAFTVGWWDTIDIKGEIIERNKYQLTNVGYRTMLEGKCLISTSGAIFRKDYLMTIGAFDEKLSAGEEYDLYLRLSRKFRYHVHNETVFLYRRHNNNTSTINGGVKTLSSLLRILSCQKRYIKDEENYNSYLIGKKHWIELLGPQIVGEFVTFIKSDKYADSLKAFIFLLKVYPLGMVKHLWYRVLKKV